MARALAPPPKNKHRLATRAKLLLQTLQPARAHARHDVGFTQVIDRLWQTLDGYIPSGLNAKRGQKVNPVVWQYMYSFMWRHNLLGKPLRPSLGALCRRSVA